MAGFWPADSNPLIWIATPDGGLAVERGKDDGQGNILLSQGGHIRRKRAFFRGKHGDHPMPFVAALTSGLSEQLAAEVQTHVGYCLPTWLVVDMRLHLDEKFRAGRLILAGKRVPVAADSRWDRFDPITLAAWDFRLDNTAVPLLGGGFAYTQITAFTPAQWQRVSGPGGWGAAEADLGKEPLRSGAPGRPTSMHLVDQEHGRRLAEGAAEKSVGAEAAYLAAWLRTAHPNAPAATAKTIENNIRPAHRRQRSASPK